MLLTEGNPVTPYDPPPLSTKLNFLIHISRLVLIDHLLVLLILGSHLHQWKGFLFFHTVICKYHMAFEMSTVSFHDQI